jgi:hypothetical protein
MLWLKKAQLHSVKASPTRYSSTLGRCPSPLGRDKILEMEYFVRTSGHYTGTSQRQNHVLGTFDDFEQLLSRLGKLNEIMDEAA